MNTILEHLIRDRQVWPEFQSAIVHFGERYVKNLWK